MFSLITAIMLAGTSAAPADRPPSPSPERRQELLFDAARIGRVDMIEPLITAGTNVDAYDQRGFTPLILAAYSGHASAVEALIAAGADPCRPDAAQGNTAQMGVAFKGDDAIAERLLKAGCDVNFRNKAGQTALMMAALFSRTRQVELLLAAGADPAIADAGGRTASALAAAQGNEVLAARLGERR